MWHQNILDVSLLVEAFLKCPGQHILSCTGQLSQSSPCFVCLGVYLHRSLLRITRDWSEGQSPRAVWPSVPGLSTGTPVPLLSRSVCCHHSPNNYDTAQQPIIGQTFIYHYGLRDKTVTSAATDIYFLLCVFYPAQSSFVRTFKKWISDTLAALCPFRSPRRWPAPQTRSWWAASRWSTLCNSPSLPPWNSRALRKVCASSKC